MKIEVAESAHWYRPDGTARHGATLREARKEGLYPSVTTILACWPKDGLKTWLRKQDILAAATTPRLQDETDDAWVERVLESAGEASTTAAAWGTLAHDALMVRLTTGEWPENESMKEFFAAWDPWIRENILKILDVEKVVVANDYGYAGTMDLRCELKDIGLAICDWKTQDVRDKPRFWDTWAYQLEAYRVCCTGEESIVSVVLNKNKPEAPHPHLWDDDPDAWECFDVCRRLWRLHKNYHPGDPI